MKSRTLTATAQLTAAFWERRWPAEARLARRVTWVGICLSFIGFLVDWQMVGVGPTFWVLSALRAVSVLAFLPLLHLVYQPERSRYVELASLTAFAGLSALQAALPVLKPTGAPIQAASQIVIFILWCLLFPGRLPSKVVGGLLGWAAWATVALQQHFTAGYSQLTDFYTIIPGQLGSIVLAPLGVNFLERTQLRESVATQRLAMANKQLEQEVKKRARREEQLSVAKQAAEEANRAKSVFLARMSHELRTPLGGVLGAAGAFDETALRPDQRALLEMMRSSGQVLRTLVDEVLDLERIETGRLELHTEPVDVRRVADRAVDVCSVAAYAKGVEVAGVVSPDVPAQLALDPVRLEQVLINLLGNGVKFTARGEVRLDLRFTDGTKPALEIQVRDTGRGIAPERLETVFEPYDRGDPDLERRYGGSGLGLAISRQIVEAMGGQISVASALEEGSVFNATLPVAVPPDDSLPDAPAPKIGGLVLISAHEATRESVAAAAAFHGVRVATAASAKEALDAWRAAGGKDAIVVDAGGDPDPLGAQLAEAVGDAAPLVLAVQPLQLAEAQQWGARHHFTALTTRPVTLARVARALVEPAREPSGPLATPPRVLRVLVVDDDLVSRKIAQSLIHRLGHEVDVVPDGTSALEAAGGNAYDVFVIDLHMPDMMGTELATALRERLGDRPYLLALTAAAMPTDRKRCLEAGMNEFLTKPVDVGSLRTAFEAIELGPPEDPSV